MTLQDAKIILKAFLEELQSTSSIPTKELDARINVCIAINTVFTELEAVTRERDELLDRRWK